MSEENITMISTFLENTKLPPDFVIEKIELIKALKTCHHVYRDYLARNIWTLTHPENQLKRDLVDIYSSVYFVLDSILKGFFIVAMEWVSETGTGDIVVFDGYGTFLVIELKTTANESVKSQSVRYCQDWEKLFPSFHTFAAFYAVDTFAIFLNEKWVEIDLKTSQNLKFSHLISQQNLAELSCSSGVPSLLRRHTVFAEYLVGLFNFAVVKSNVVSLKNDFVDFKGDLYNFLEDIKFFYIWAVDLEVRVGPKYIRSDVVMADEGENLLFFWICQKITEKRKKEVDELINHFESNNIFRNVRGYVIYSSFDKAEVKSVLERQWLKFSTWKFQK